MVEQSNETGRGENPLDQLIILNFAPAQLSFDKAVKKLKNPLSDLLWRASESGSVKLPRR